MKTTKLNYTKSTETDSSEDTLMPTIGQNLTAAIANPETEIDKNGVERAVGRVKIQDQKIGVTEVATNKNITSKPSEAAVDAGKRMVENQDKNSDIASNREFLSE